MKELLSDDTLSDPSSELCDDLKILTTCEAFTDSCVVELVKLNNE